MKRLTTIKLSLLLLTTFALAACGDKEVKYEDIPKFDSASLNQHRTLSGVNALKVFKATLATTKYTGKYREASCATDSDISYENPYGDATVTCSATSIDSGRQEDFKCSTTAMLPCFTAEEADDKKQYKDRGVNAQRLLIERYTASLKDGSGYGLPRLD